MVSPTSAVEIDRIGGVGVLNLEGLWARYEDPQPLIDEIATLGDDAALAALRRAMQTPLDPDLVGQRIKELRAAGVVSAGAVTPQRTVDLADVIIAAELDLLVIEGTVVSAEHVSGDDAEPLNLKTFVRRFDMPVIVGGCASYQAALHLMRTGAAGVLVGGGATSDEQPAVLGVGVPQATAIADARAARMRHLDETGRVRPRHRRRRHVDRRRHRQGRRLRRRRRDARLAARRGHRGPRRGAAHWGTGERRTRRCRGAASPPRTGRHASKRSWSARPHDTDGRHEPVRRAARPRWP